MKFDYVTNDDSVVCCNIGCIIFRALLTQHFFNKDWDKDISCGKGNLGVVVNIYFWCLKWFLPLCNSIVVKIPYSGPR